MVSWNWDESASESGVVHQSTANTDHNDASILKQGYDFQNFSEVSTTPAHAWPLHEDSGTTDYDVVGTLDGTYNGPTLGQTGLFGTTAPSFDGNDDWVEHTNPSEVENSVTHSYFVVCYPQDVSSGETVNIYGNDWLIRLFFNSGSVGYRVRDSSLGSRTDLSGGSPSTDTWHTLCGTYDGSTMTLYLNGSQVDSGSLSISSFNSPSGQSFGTFRGGDSKFFAGRIAGVWFWDSAISASEVQSLHDVVATQGAWESTTKTL